MINQVRRVYSFLRHNSNKYLYLEALFLSAFFRLCILLVPINKLQKRMGTLNEESDQDLAEARYNQVSRISYVVNRLCELTPWESKCLVRALTAQYLLKKKKIPSTLYLGVGKDGSCMMAHAWLRSGSYYVTGGYGNGFSIVAKFRS